MAGHLAGQSPSPAPSGGRTSAPERSQCSAQINNEWNGPNCPFGLGIMALSARFYKPCQTVNELFQRQTVEFDQAMFPNSQFLLQSPLLSPPLGQFLAPSSTEPSPLSAVLHALNLQMLLDHQRQSLLQSLLALSAVAQSGEANFYGEKELAEEHKELDGIKEEAELLEVTEGVENIEEGNAKKCKGGHRKRKKQKEEVGTETKERRKTNKRRREETETDSPVSGMFIKESCDAEELRLAAAELDDSAAFVHITEDTRSAIAAIPNVIGESVCALCKIHFNDVFRLAMHKCPRIRHEEYRCRECEKVFSCPANLASHRRWHRPRAEGQRQQNAVSMCVPSSELFHPLPTAADD